MYYIFIILFILYVFKFTISYKHIFFYIFKGMKTPKKRLTFKTPKRSAKTPLKTKNVIKKDSAEQKKSNLEDVDDEIKNTEKELIESLTEENEFLRNSNPYNNLLGLNITQSDDKYVVKYTIDKNNRYIHFELMPEDDMFVYQLIHSDNIEELGIFNDEISFEKNQINKFFYKIMEIMISD